MMDRKRRLWIAVLILTVIEQGIKLVINQNYLEANTRIIPPWIYFKPMFNRDYSWFNSMLQLNVGKGIHIVGVIGILILIYLIFKFLDSRNIEGKAIDTMFAFVIAGAICSLIDKVFWDGSLDYILLKGFFTFDLKDVYINVFNGLLLLMLITDYKGLRKVDENEVFKEFGRFIRKK